MTREASHPAMLWCRCRSSHVAGRQRGISKRRSLPTRSCALDERVCARQAHCGAHAHALSGCRVRAVACLRRCCRCAALRRSARSPRSCARRVASTGLAARGVAARRGAALRRSWLESAPSPLRARSRCRCGRSTRPFRWSATCRRAPLALARGGARGAAQPSALVSGSRRSCPHASPARPLLARRTRSVWCTSASRTAAAGSA